MLAYNFSKCDMTFPWQGFLCPHVANGIGSRYPIQSWHVSSLLKSAPTLLIQHCSAARAVLVTLRVPFIGSPPSCPGPSDEDLGSMLNMFNLAAVAVVIAASLKTQIFNMRKKVNKMKKSLRYACKKIHKFVRDPCAVCTPEVCHPIMARQHICATTTIPFQVPDRRPFTDGISVHNYMIGLEDYMPLAFQVRNHTECLLKGTTHYHS